MRSLIIGATLLATCAASHAVQVTCYTDPKTDAATCYTPSRVTENNGIRTAPLSKGGPNGVRPTGFTIAVNCATQVVHLKDRDGVSFAGGGPGEGTRAMRALRDWICQEPLKPKK